MIRFVDYYIMNRYTLRVIYSLFLLIPSLSFANVDSVGMETIGGNTYLLHRVEQSEGFYGIARKYKISVSELQTANPREGNALKLGEILKVPYHKATPSKIITNTAKEEPKKNIPATSQTNNPGTYQAKHTHKVGKGETLFSISKKYNVTVPQVKEWNNLTSNNLKLGQELIIQKTSIQIPLNPGTDERHVITSSVPSSSPSSNMDSYTNSIEKSENGMASWINDKNLNPQKSIALHKTAPIGTIVKVTNKMNNRSIYVKVIGTLPETGDNSNTIIVVSKAAAVMLDVRDPKFQVTLNYSIPKE
jgi:LysM repeat protein